MLETFVFLTHAFNFAVNQTHKFSLVILLRLVYLTSNVLFLTYTYLYMYTIFSIHQMDTRLKLKFLYL